MEPLEPLLPLDQGAGTQKILRMMKTFVLMEIQKWERGDGLVLHEIVVQVPRLLPVTLSTIGST